jgi:hypothetical protein
MSIDAFVLDHAAEIQVGQEPRVLGKVHLEPGKSYVVFAKGLVVAGGAGTQQATFRLEALLPEATDETRMVLDVPWPLTHGSFSLAVATTLPPDPDLFVDATLSGHCEIVCQVSNLKIIAVAVDSVTVTTS